MHLWNYWNFLDEGFRNPDKMYLVKQGGVRTWDNILGQGVWHHNYYRIFSPQSYENGTRGIPKKREYAYESALLRMKMYPWQNQQLCCNLPAVLYPERVINCLSVNGHLWHFAFAVLLGTGSRGYWIQYSKPQRG